MKLSVELTLAAGTALVAVVLAYAELRNGLSDIQKFKVEAQEQIQRTARKIERLEIRLSHQQSWADETRRKQR